MELKLTKAHSNKGFTLIELVTVLVIMSISFLIIIPKIESDTKLNLNKSARKLAGVIIYVRNEAIFKKKNLRLMYRIEKGTYSIKEIVKARTGFMQEDYEEKEIGAASLDDGVSFMDIETIYGGKINFGKAYTHFFTSGMVENTLIHLKNKDDKVKTLAINVLTGEVDIYDEYFEEEDF